MKLDRRHFCQLSVLAALAAGTRAAVGAPGARNAQMAVQLYSISAYVNRNGLDKTFAELAKIGFTGIEFQHLFGQTPAMVKGLLAAHHLTPVGCHVPCRDFDPERIQQACAYHLAYGNNLLICAGDGNFPGPHEDLDEFLKRHVARYNRGCEIAERMGCHIGLHNHRHEFDLKMKDGTTYWDYFFSHTDARVRMEQDVGWTTCAGVDPCQEWRKYPGRSITFHAKEDNGWKAGIGDRDVKSFDGILGQPARPCGRGVDWAAVARAADADHIPWWVVECEKHFESLEIVRKSYEFLRARGR